MENTTTLIDVLEWISQHFLGFISFLSLFIEIAPIKIKPLTFIVNWLNKPVRNDIEAMKSELQGNIDNIKKELKGEIDQIRAQQAAENESIDQLIKSCDLAEMSRIRWEIIEFSNSIENGQMHVRDEYRHIMDDNRKYHALIKKYKMENGIIDEEMEKINNHYEENKNSTSVYF